MGGDGSKAFPVGAVVFDDLDWFFDRECGSVVHSMAGFWAFWGGMVVASTARIFDSPGYDAISCYFDASAYNA